MDSKFLVRPQSSAPSTSVGAYDRSSSHSRPVSAQYTVPPSSRPASARWGRYRPASAKIYQMRRPPSGARSIDLVSRPSSRPPSAVGTMARAHRAAATLHTHTKEHTFQALPPEVAMEQRWLRGQHREAEEREEAKGFYSKMQAWRLGKARAEIEISRASEAKRFVSLASRRELKSRGALSTLTDGLPGVDGPPPLGKVVRLEEPPRAEAKDILEVIASLSSQLKRRARPLSGFIRPPRPRSSGVSGSSSRRFLSPYRTRGAGKRGGEVPHACKLKPKEVEEGKELEYLKELRITQFGEVQKIRRHFALAGLPFPSSALQEALVLPSQDLKSHVSDCPVVPRLVFKPGWVDPALEKKGKPKKKGKGKGKGKKKVGGGGEMERGEREGKRKI